MKRLMRSLVVLMLAVSLLASLPAVPASAAGAADAQKWNIMLVVDASGSLYSRVGTSVPADPNGLRFEAIASFLAVLHDEGHNVGALAFDAASKGEDPTEGAIVFNTGLMSLDNRDPSWATGYGVKEHVMDELRSHLPNQSGPSTDIGSALLRAVETLEQAGNDWPCAILLFTDGAFHSVYQDVSNENCRIALDKIRNWNGDIELCGVYLNARDNSNSGSATLRDILTDIYGDALGNHYVEITNANECVASTDKFMRLLGFVNDPDQNVIYGDFEDSFLIPGVGVEAVSIRLHVKDSMYLPDMDVQILPPNSSIPISPAANTDITLKTGNTFQVWKIKNPAAGKWTVRVKVNKNSDVGVTYTPIYSMNIGAGLLTTPASGQMHMKQDVSVKAWLTQNGVEITDPAKYSQYNCYLTISDLQTGNVVREDELFMTNGSYTSNTYFDQSYLPYGEYFVQARFQCGDIVVTAPVEQWNLRNNLPVCKTDRYYHPTIGYGFMEPETEQIDVSGFFTDAEDGKNISIVVDPNRSTCNASGVEVVNGIMTITPSLSGDGEVALYAVDQDGASTQNSALCTVRISVQDLTLRNIIMLAAVVVTSIIVLFLIIFWKKNRDNTFIPDGECRLTVEVDNKPLVIEMTPPGVEGKRSTNLQAMITRTLQKGAESEYSRLAEVCRKAGISVDELSETLAEDAGQLKKVNVSVKLGKAKGKKGKVAMIQVSYQKTNAVLYGRSMSLTINGKPYDFGYFLPQEDETDIFNDYGAMGKDPNKEADDFMNNMFGDMDMYSQMDPVAPSSGKGGKKQPAKKSKDVDLFDGFDDI